VGAGAQQAAEDALAVLARADERIGERGRYLNHLLIRSESISSSWIEGNRVTPKRLAIAELLHQGPRQALDVVANVRATEAAIDSLADRARVVTTESIVSLQHVIEPRLEPGLRREQNWVGGPGWSPLRAAFVPPPETEVPRLVDDLARFVTGLELDSLSADLDAFVPGRLIDALSKQLSLATVKPPLDPGIDEQYLFYPTRAQMDPGSIWLRNIMLGIGREMERWKT